jgi:hypothetical protein
MKRAGAKRLERPAAIAVLLLCAIVASLAVAPAPAAAEESDSAEIRNLSDGGLDFPDITGPAAPEEYPFRLSEGNSEIRVRQIGDQEVIGEYIEGGYRAWTIAAEPAHDADGATVPTTVKLTEGDIVTLIVHYRAGNPAAAGAPFVFPIVGGPGWSGGWFYGSVEINEPTPGTQPTPPAPTCKVPSLRGISLGRAKARLRAAHCAIGQVHLAAGATAGKGKVVKQFRTVGSDLAAGAPVAVKLGSR